MYVHFCSNTPEAMTTDAPAKTEKGWTAVKTVPVALTRILDGSPLFKAAEAGLRATREARSDDTDILLDLPCHLTPQMAIQYGKFFEDYHPLFLEEPTQAEKPRAMARIPARSPHQSPPASTYSPAGASARSSKKRPLAYSRPRPIIPAASSEIRRIVAMAEVHYAGLAPHNPYGPISTATCIHVDFAAPNFVIQKISRSRHRTHGDGTS